MVEGEGGGRGKGGRGREGERRNYSTVTRAAGWTALCPFGSGKHVPPGAGGLASCSSFYYECGAKCQPGVSVLVPVVVFITPFLFMCLAGVVFSCED